MAKKSKRVKSKEQRERDNGRRLVLFLPDADWKREMIETAHREGFEHRLSGAEKATPNVTAYIMWLHKQHKKVSEKKAA